MNGIEQSTLWIMGAVLLVVGIAIGLLMARRFLPGTQRANELEKELETIRAEQTAYRKQVTQHFEKTGELFQEMAKGYRTVYDHLAHGAHELCGEGTRTPRLDLPEKQLLTQTSEGASPESGSEPTTPPGPAATQTGEARPNEPAPEPSQTSSPPPSSDVTEERPRVDGDSSAASEATDAPRPTADSPSETESRAEEKASKAEGSKERPVVH